jgi:hypothetical protein
LARNRTGHGGFGGENELVGRPVEMRQGLWDVEA